MEVLPEDVVFTILLWLPVASLLRFKSVCKSWCSLIESSPFITQHLAILKDNNNNDDHQLIILDPSQCDDTPCYSLRFSLLSGTGDNYKVPKVLDLPHHFDNALESPKIIASCNGIICLQPDLSQNVSLWNPALREFRILPKPSVPPELVPDSGLGFYFGFGYDAKTNDYKVVKVIFLNLMTCRVDLYSLSTDSWRPIDTVVPFPYVFSHPKAPLRNGIYCWLGEDESERHAILSFDFTTEVFKTMTVPDVYGDVHGVDSPAYLRLALLRENLACIEWVFYSNDPYIWHCKIWVLNEYDVMESWTKLYTIELELFAYPCAVLMNGKIIGYGSNEGRLCFWDLVIQELKYFPLDPVSFVTEVVVYNATLLSIKSTVRAANKVSSVDLTENQLSAIDLALLKQVLDDRSSLVMADYGHVDLAVNCVKNKQKIDNIVWEGGSRASRVITVFGNKTECACVPLSTALGLPSPKSYEMVEDVMMMGDVMKNWASIKSHRDVLPHVLFVFINLYTNLVVME
ncbi:hypothetical protein IFM89_009947 [Coptis chinensis]|uniref:F-box domain-containing protein n=1 Tax=Coptis chinensis TaxID=261450 RepID=A0A835HM13_9MAGN|nr:hypothetical protein IFM89_009947 [Coptis chinensis]